MKSVALPLERPYIVRHPRFGVLAAPLLVAGRFGRPVVGATVAPIIFSNRKRRTESSGYRSVRNFCDSGACDGVTSRIQQIMFTRARRQPNTSVVHQRQISQVKTLTRSLIEIANRGDCEVTDFERVSSESLAPVRNVRRAQQALLDSVHSAVSSGLGSDYISGALSRRTTCRARLTGIFTGPQVSFCNTGMNRRMMENTRIPNRFMEASGIDKIG